MSLLDVLMHRVENLKNAVVVAPDIDGHEVAIARTATQRGIESPQGLKKALRRLACLRLDRERPHRLVTD